MKIAELRSIINGHSKKQLEYLVAEFYKLIPKDKKEDYDIDTMVKNPAKEKATKKKTIKIRTIEEISEEVDLFDIYAREQYYLIPNRVISKKERPKWRFLVKRLYKEILIAANNGNSLTACAKELRKLYEVLTYSCAWQLFSAYDTFESVGISQSEFFEQIIKLYRKSLDINDFVFIGIKLIIDNNLNRYTLYSELMDIYLKHCETPDMREQALKAANKFRDETEKIPDNPDYFYKKKYGMSYEKINKLNLLTELIIKIYIELFNINSAVEFFKKYYIESDAEIKLYILIRFLFNANQPEIIVKEIENNMKVKPRGNLINLLNYIKKNGELPEYM